MYSTLPNKTINSPQSIYHSGKFNLKRCENFYGNKTFGYPMNRKNLVKIKMVLLFCCCSTVSSFSISIFLLFSGKFANNKHFYVLILNKFPVINDLTINLGSFSLFLHPSLSFYRKKGRNNLIALSMFNSKYI